MGVILYRSMQMGAIMCRPMQMVTFQYKARLFVHTKMNGGYSVQANADGIILYWLMRMGLIL